MVLDRFGRFNRSAVLRWRLQPDKWRLEGAGACSDRYRFEVITSVPVERCEIVDGWESRYYMKKEKIPLLEVEVHKAGEFSTVCSSLP